MGVKVLTGFTEEVEWFESLAFELRLFETLTWYNRPDFAKATSRTTHGQLARRPGFVMVR